MTREKTLKAAIRQRMATTGEPYNVARRAVFEAVAKERMGPARPTTAGAETPVPEAAVPETAVPETAVPETAVPETAVPETAVPETAGGNAGN